MMKRISVVILLASCGDNLLPDLTWRDAAAAWSDAWCSYAERCFPARFDALYENHHQCTAKVTRQNCKSGAYDCDAAYPHTEDDILACHADMAALDCRAQFAPDSCYDAFREGP